MVEFLFFIQKKRFRTIVLVFRDNVYFSVREMSSGLLTFKFPCVHPESSPGPLMTLQMCTIHVVY